VRGLYEGGRRGMETGGRKREAMGRERGGGRVRYEKKANLDRVCSEFGGGNSGGEELLRI